MNATQFITIIKIDAICVCPIDTSNTGSHLEEKKENKQ
jgi:hypothetical protein